MKNGKWHIQWQFNTYYLGLFLFGDYLRQTYPEFLDKNYWWLIPVILFWTSLDIKWTWSKAVKQ